MRFAPHTDDDVGEMLAEIGLSSLDELYSHLPPGVVLSHDLDIAEGLSEMELISDMRNLAARSLNTDGYVCFAGGGAYDHFIPAVVWAMAGRSEFYTSYTPYQAELSQGVLQALFEYQSMICDLTGLDVSNASLYDGATALVEAVHMAVAATRGSRVLVSEGVNPRYVEALRTYGRGLGYVVDSLALADGVTQAQPLRDGVAAVVVQHPNVFGNLEPDARDVFRAARDGGARAIEVFDPLSLGVLAPPGELGADIAVAEGQSLGNHLSYGGPYLGVIAARDQDLRRMPGRIAGETTDVDGRTGYVLTLQAREQHIRREKATSNICTNQTLMAIAATVYLAWLGPAGLETLGRQCDAKARFAAERLCEIDGVEPAFPGAGFFKEFALRVDGGASRARDALLEKGFLTGPALGSPAGPEVLLVSVTERRSREEIEALSAALGAVMAS